MLICEEIGYIASIVPRNFAKTALKIEKGRGRGIKYEPKMLRLWCVFSEKPEQEVFISRTKTKKFTRHVFRGRRHREVGS